MTVAKIKVALVDDQPLFSSGLEMLIEAQPDMTSVGTAIDGQRGHQLVVEMQPDVVLMDLRMPVMNGIQATRAILEDPDIRVSPKVIALTTIQKDEAVFQALKAGAVEFLTKDSTPALVLQAIRRAHPDSWMVPAFEETKDLIRSFGSPADSGRSVPVDDLLTKREKDVLMLVVQGLSNADIAAAAFLSEATVKTHIRSILQKLGLRSRVQIVIFAYENGLVKGRD